MMAVKYDSLPWVLLGAEEMEGFRRTRDLS